jgi:transposase
MNREQRREMMRKMQSEDLSLEVVHPDAAGIDIGNEVHYVAVPPNRSSEAVLRFGCTTAGLKAMADWLKQCGIRTVAMQSTGVYWVAAFDILEAAGLEVYLVNARETKNLPGRKSDVPESQWLMKLHTYGLLRNSFRPSQEIRTLRTYWRQRNDLVRAAGRHIRRMQKALTQMNLQLANVLSDISGRSGQAIIKAILAGERDAGELAALCDCRVQASQEEVAASLEGNWQDDLLFVLQQEQEGYEFCQKQMAECDRHLQEYLQHRADRSQDASLAVEKRKERRKKKRGNTPQFDLRAALFRMVGTDLTRIDSIDVIGEDHIRPSCGAVVQVRWLFERRTVTFCEENPDVRYWWVNQNQTYRREIDGGYLWSPKRNANGARNPFYEFMRGNAGTQHRIGKTAMLRCQHFGRLCWMDDVHARQSSTERTRTDERSESRRTRRVCGCRGCSEVLVHRAQERRQLLELARAGKIPAYPIGDGQTSALAISTVRSRGGNGKANGLWKKDGREHKASSDTIKCWLLHNERSGCAAQGLCLMSCRLRFEKPLQSVLHSGVPKHPKMHQNCCTAISLSQTTYARLGLFVIGRSSVQVRSSAPGPLLLH